MNRTWKRLVTISGAVLALSGGLLAANTPARADLAPAILFLKPNLVIDGFRFGNLWAGATVPAFFVTVKNAGVIGAPASQTRILANGNTYILATPALGPGQSIPLAVPLSSQFGVFSATADVSNTVAESNEGDNTFAFVVDPAL